MQATIDISKKITLIKEVKNGMFSVNTYNFNEIAEITKGVTVLEYKGIASPAKFNKYIGVLIGLGFSISNTLWNQSAGFEGKNADNINFNIELKRTA